MALTSAQVRTMLKPMADFAPAILRCAEILEAAEGAEARVKDAEKALNAVNHEAAQVRESIAEFEKRRDAARAEAIEAKTKLDGLKDEFGDKRKAQREAFESQLADAQKQVASVHNDVEKARAEIYALHATRDKIKAEIEALKKKFAA